MWFGTMLILALDPSSVVTLGTLDRLADVVTRHLSSFPEAEVQEPVCKGSPYTEEFMKVLYAQQCIHIKIEIELI